MTLTSPIASAAGSSLVEVIVATSLVATSLVGVAQLFASAISSNIVSQATTFTTTLAAQKLEQLRSDTGLTRSPPDALEEDTPGYVDYVDASGNASDERRARDRALYVRRWSVEPLPVDPENALILQVHVARIRRAASRDRLPGDARMVMVKAKVPP